MGISDFDSDAHGRRPWNAGNMDGSKRPLKPRRRLGDPLLSRRAPAIARPDALRFGNRQQLRGCDIVKMKISDIASGGAIRNLATVMQQKTKRPVQFEIMTEARQTL